MALHPIHGNEDVSLLSYNNGITYICNTEFPCKIALCQKLDLNNVHITVFDARPRLCFVDGESRMCFICLNGGQLNIHLEYSDNVTAAFTVLTLLVWAFVKQADANG